MKKLKIFAVMMLLCLTTYIGTVAFCTAYNLTTDNSVTLQLSELEYVYVRDITETEFARVIMHSFSLCFAVGVTLIAFVIYDIYCSLKRMK